MARKLAEAEKSSSMDMNAAKADAVDAADIAVNAAGTALEVNGQPNP